MKSLVIYFSHTGENYMEDGLRNIDKGNTEIVAETIRDIVGADLFKVEAIKEYPYGYKECCDVAKVELNADARPELKNIISDINAYDIIYIGGPVWWDHYPCAMFTALSNLDFTGKIVKPFTTHEGSGLGSVMQDINRFCGGAIVKEGIAIQGSSAGKAKDMLDDWCSRL